MNKTRGFLHGISLTSFLQVVEIERKTCVLTVQADKQEGHLFFRDGTLVDADSGSAVGLEAVHQIVNWPDPEIEISASAHERPRRIEQSVIEILLNGSQLADEGKRPLGAGSVTPAAAVVPAGQADVAEGGHTDPGSPDSAAPQPAPESAAAAIEKESPMNDLQQILDRFRDEVPEFVSTDIVNFDSGLSIGGRSLDPDFDASVAAACYAEVVKSNRRALELLGYGANSTEDILISTAKVYLLVRLLGAEYCQIVAITRKGNLGLARAIMKKHERELLAAIGELS